MRVAQRANQASRPGLGLHPGLELGAAAVLEPFEVLQALVHGRGQEALQQVLRQTAALTGVGQLLEADLSQRRLQRADAELAAVLKRDRVRVDDQRGTGAGAEPGR